MLLDDYKRDPSFCLSPMPRNVLRPPNRPRQHSFIRPASGRSQPLWNPLPAWSGPVGTERSVQRRGAASLELSVVRPMVASAIQPQKDVCGDPEQLAERLDLSLGEVPLPVEELRDSALAAHHVI